MSSVIVIGGGASGMMCACTAASFGHKVILIEKNEKLGKKIYITGKGRCNFTNACDPADFFQNVVSNPKFLYSAIYSFDSSSVIDFFEKNGMSTKVERGNRAFPLSDHASDVTRTLENVMKKNGVEIHLNEEVKDIMTSSKNIFEIRTTKAVYTSDNVVIATGGLSYPLTGSTGDGYAFAENFGILLKDRFPSLVPFNTKEDYIKEMQGLSLKNVELTIYDDSAIQAVKEDKAYINEKNINIYKSKKCKPVYKDFGEMMFTHFGVTGPLVLSASSRCTKLLKNNHTLVCFINLKPALSRDQLDQRLIREFEANPLKSVSSIIRGLLPAKMLPVFLRLLSFDENIKTSEVTKEMRTEIIEKLTAFPFTIESTRGFNEAIITQGGVAVSEINPSTMESKKVPGLYFTGEVLDLDAYTGGFNLQIAFSTGYLAGISLA